MRLLRLVAILLLFTRAWPQALVIPDTPAGHTLQAWLDAFNSGDRTRVDAYVAKYDPNNSADQMLAFRAQTGGYELIGIDTSDSLHIVFRVKDKEIPTISLGKLAVVEGDPARVSSFGLRAIPRDRPAPPDPDHMNLKIDAATRARVIDGAVANLNEFYVFPEVAKKMEEALRTRHKKGEYDNVDDADTFASLLTDHLQEVSHDKHLHVRFSQRVLPKGLLGRDPDSETRMRIELERTNCFLQKVERFPSNVGYVKLNAFPNPEICGPTVTAAMNVLGDVDAVIFDLRDNGGGEPKMVAFVLTYLFDKPTHVNDMYTPKDNRTTEYWTLRDVPGKRLTGKPVFVLTSNRTFSGAEEFAYDLKTLRRATIVGETTGGGAHPVSGHRIDDHFMIIVPAARPINPISKTDWEGTGVEPDVKVMAYYALDVAEKMAVEQVQKQRPDAKAGH